MTAPRATESRLAYSNRSPYGPVQFQVGHPGDDVVDRLIRVGVHHSA